MSDTKGLFRPLDTIEPPDQWEQISREVGGPEPSSSRRPLRFAALVSALVVTAGLIALLVATFSPSSTQPNPATRSPSISSPVVEQVALGRPSRLEVAPEGGLGSMVEAFGSVWVIGGFQQPDSGEETLRRLDPNDGSIQARFNLPVDGGGEWGGDGLTVGAGYVWASAWDSAMIFRIDPRDNSVTRFSLGGRVVSDLAFDQQTGDLWAAVAGKGDGFLLVQVNPSDGSVLSSTTYTTDWSGGLLPLQGSVWTLNRHVNNSTVSGGYLHQLLPGTAPDVETGGSFALPVTDGRWIWTPASGDDRAMNLAAGIAQVDPSDGSVVRHWNVGNVGYDVAVGPDGGVWFLGPKGLERLNPTSGKVQAWKAAEDGDTPTFILPSMGGVWVGTYEGALYFRPFIT